MLHCLEHLYADSGFHLGGVFFLILRFFCLQHLARDDYCIGGFSFAVLNRFCNPTTDLLITITILIFIFILIFTILIILIIPSILSILIILIILFVLIIVVINSFLLPSLSSSSVSFIVLVSNLINIKISALFVTCSNSKNPRETVAAFRLHLANPPLRLPPYPSPASFRTSPLASSSGWYSMILHNATRPFFHRTKWMARPCTVVRRKNMCPLGDPPRSSSLHQEETQMGSWRRRLCRGHRDGSVFLPLSNRAKNVRLVDWYVIGPY